MGKTTTYTRVPDLKKTLARVPKVAVAELRDASQAIAGELAQGAESRAQALGGVARFVPFKAKRDKVPVVQMGGTTKLPTSGNGWTNSRSGPNQTVGNIMWGAEFGSQRFSQFPPHQTRGRMLYATVDDQSEEMMQRWGDALGKALREA